MSCNLCIGVKAKRNGFVDIVRRSESALPVKIMATTLLSRFRSIFCPFVLFRKTVVSTHKAVANKTPDQTLPYSDKTLFRNKAANLGHLRAAQPNCSGNVFVEKRNQCLFTIYTGKPVGLPFGSVWANGKQISVLGKFRSGLALTICRHPCHLPKNLHDGDG